MLDETVIAGIAASQPFTMRMTASPGDETTSAGRPAQQ